MFSEEDICVESGSPLSSKSQDSSPVWAIKAFNDYREPPPSLSIDEAFNTKEFFNRISYIHRQIFSSKFRPSNHHLILDVWSDAALFAGLQHKYSSSQSLSSSDWYAISAIVSETAQYMTLPEITRLLHSLVTCLYRCGPRLEPNTAMISSLSRNAMTTIKNTTVPLSTDTIIDFQSVITDLFHVARLANASPSRRRKDWSTKIITRSIPLLAAGMTAAHNLTKQLAEKLSFSCTLTTPGSTVAATADTDSSEGNRLKSESRRKFMARKEEESAMAIALIECLAPLAWCPSRLPSSSSYSASSSMNSTNSTTPYMTKSKSSKKKPTSSSSPSVSLWRRFACFGMPQRVAEVYSHQQAAQDSLITAAPPNATATKRLDLMLHRVNLKATSIAQWIERSLLPCCIRYMTHQQLDDFIAALLVVLEEEDADIFARDEAASLSSATTKKMLTTSMSARKSLANKQGTILSNRSSLYTEQSSSDRDNSCSGYYTSAAYDETDDQKYSSSAGMNKNHRDALVHCAAIALEEASRRVQKHEEMTVSEARRMVWCAQRILETVPAKDSALFTMVLSVLDGYVKEKEDEEDASLKQLTTKNTLPIF